jgi:3',5'-cyclic AMP phosphodiesterase CpdA
MSVILHLSDLHVHAKPDHPNNRRLAAIVAAIVARYAGQTPVIVCTGDLVDDGERAQFEQLVTLMAPLKAAGFRVIAAPGNHDSGPMGNSYEVSARVYFQKYVVAGLMGIKVADTATDLMDQLYPLVHRFDGVTFIGLDSVVGMLDEGMHFARGAVGTKQIAALKDLLDVKEDNPRVVYLHHHPFDRKFVLALKDSAALMKVLENRYNLLLFGHKHRSQTWPGGGDTVAGTRVVVASGKTTDVDDRQCFELREARVGAGQVTVSCFKVAI